MIKIEAHMVVCINGPKGNLLAYECREIKKDGKKLRLIYSEGTELPVDPGRIASIECKTNISEDLK